MYVTRRDVKCMSQLVAIRQSTHSAHNSEHIVIASIHSDLGSVGAGDSRVRQNKLKGRVINAREVA